MHKHARWQITREPRSSNAPVFILGMLVAASAVVFLYYATREDGRPAGAAHGNTSKVSGTPHAANGEPQDDVIAQFNKPVQTDPIFSYSDPPPADPPENEYVQHVAPPQKDGIVSSIIHQRYVVPPDLFALGDLSDSYYLVVEFKTFNKPRWVLSRDQWIEARKAVTLHMEGNRKHPAPRRTQFPSPDYFWAENHADNSTLLRMVFVCPNAARPNAFTLAGQLWPLEKVTTSGR